MLWQLPEIISARSSCNWKNWSNTQLITKKLWDTNADTSWCFAPNHQNNHILDGCSLVRQFGRTLNRSRVEALSVNSISRPKSTPSFPLTLIFIRRRILVRWLVLSQASPIECTEARLARAASMVIGKPLFQGGHKCISHGQSSETLKYCMPDTNAQGQMVYQWAPATSNFEGWKDGCYTRQTQISNGWKSPRSISGP